MQENWFIDWFNSSYYHLLYKNRDENEAAAFIKNLVRELNPNPSSKIIDIACGKGRHAQWLADFGFDVTGIDISINSIQEAAKHEKDNLHFFTHDMRLPFWINYFDYAFNFFTSFGYFKSQRENQNAVKSIAASLVTGGYFLIDYMNAGYAESNIVHSEQQIIDGICFSITRWYDEKKIYKKILIEDPSVSNPMGFIEEVQKFSLVDFEKLLMNHGLVIQKTYGDYNFSVYDERISPRLIILARKNPI